MQFCDSVCFMEERGCPIFITGTMSSSVCVEFYIMYVIFKHKLNQTLFFQFCFLNYLKTSNMFKDHESNRAHRFHLIIAANCI